MAKRSSPSLAGRILAFLVIVILLLAIVGAVFEFFIAPSPDKIEAKYKNTSNVGIGVTSGKILGVETAIAPAGLELLSYGYSNSSITENVTAFVTISYTEEKDGNKTTYLAAVIYFDSMKDAYTANDGIKSKVKENEKVSMVRGKALVIGEKKAVLKYYAVIF